MVDDFTKVPFRARLVRAGTAGPDGTIVEDHTVYFYDQRFLTRASPEGLLIGKREVDRLHRRQAGVGISFDTGEWGDAIGGGPFNQVLRWIAGEIPARRGPRRPRG